jgi:hypothetical protein
LIDPALSHEGVWIPPWQLTFEHRPLAPEGLNEVFAAPFDRCAPATSGTFTLYRLLSMCVPIVATQSIDDGTYPAWQSEHFDASFTPVEIVYALSCAPCAPTFAHGSPDPLVPVELWHSEQFTVADAYHAGVRTL